MITLRDFSIGFDRRLLLDNVSAQFQSATLTALIGRNGAGKSTMLRAIAGLNSRYRGTILLDGSPLDRMPRPDLARRLAFVSTERTRIPNMRCRDIVALGRAPYTNWIGNLTPADHEAVMQSLTAVGMQSYADRSMNTMSDGECQRIMIARALAQDTPNILLDEPTSFLDLPNRYELAALLRTLAHEHGKCVLFSTHELDVAMHTCDSIALIDNGNLHNMPVADMKASGHIQRLFHTPGII